MFQDFIEYQGPSALARCECGHLLVMTIKNTSFAPILIIHCVHCKYMETY